MARKETLEARAAAGGKQVSASFTKAELELLERAKAAGGFKTNKEALVAGLRALERANEVTNAELLALLKARLKA